MFEPSPSDHLPLLGLRVIECSGARLEGCGRMLADLGADVILIEPPSGLAARLEPPLHQGVSLAFEAHHANKRSVVLDLMSSEDRQRFERLLDSADLLIESLPPGKLDAMGLGPAALRATRPSLVVLSISDYGQIGPRRDQVATEAVLAATSGCLCRSGLPGLPPLLPPAGLVTESTAVQAVWVALLGLWQRAQTGACDGVGDWLDFSIHDGASQVLDPPMGATGSASAGKSALDSTPPGRPAAMPLYPIIPCKDGHVRICVLNPRQWQAMSAWLGPDHAFTDPQYGNIGKRMAVASALNARIGELFATFTAKELVVEGQRRGVPIAAVATPDQVLQDEHFNARNAFVPVAIDTEGSTVAQGRIPSGYLEIDGQRAGWRRRAPALNQDAAAVFAEWVAASDAPRVAQPEPTLQRRPLQGIRVLDLGVIVAGAEAGRLLADQGAEVIKIENRAFADGGRQSAIGDLMTPSIAQGQRNKQSMGVNLRSAAGRDIFKQLAAKSDVVLSNFKPGTLESLGLGYDVLSAINPRIVMMDSSALGATGPMSRSMGYGPLVRAATGLTALWSYPDLPGSFSDGVTIYPDHLAGRVAAIGVLAALLRRERTGRGGTVSVSQAEIFLNGAATHYLRESLQPGSFKPRGNVSEFRAPESVYPCAGDDQWCVVSVRDDADWQRLLAAIGRPDLAADAGLSTTAGRLTRRADVDACVEAFTRAHSPREVTQRLQAAGVPAGEMLRLSEFRDEAHFQARGVIRTLEHTGLRTPLPTENSPMRSLHIPDPALRPAPYQAEHTREVAARVLGLSTEQIDALIASGDLEEFAPPADQPA